MTAHGPNRRFLDLDDLPAGGLPPERTSDVLARFRDQLPDGPVTLGDLIAALGDRSLGTILLALSIPTVAPVPLGISVLFNLPLLLFSAQIVTGGENARLPAWLLRRSVAQGQARRMLDAVLPRLRWIERMLKPRWSRVGGVDRTPWFGMLCFVLALIAFVPVPLTGWLPGFAMVFIALGLIERDGMAVTIGLLLGAAAVAFAAVVVGGLSYAGHELIVDAELPGLGPP